MSRHAYFEIVCEGCGITLLRRNDKKSQSPYCRPCRGRKTLTTHDKAYSRIYKIWQGMKERCDNPNQTWYKRYGGRGVTYCEEWKSFENFFKWSEKNGYKDELTLDRVDPDGMYKPSNCRWATKKEQAQNRTNGLNWDAVNKIRDTIAERGYSSLANEFNVCKTTIYFVVSNKTWHDANYHPLRLNRSKSQHPTHRQSASALTSQC